MILCKALSFLIFQCLIMCVYSILPKISSIPNQVTSLSRSDCPNMENNEPTNYTEMFQEFKAIVSTKKYNNSHTKYYVMTPSSAPKFENPDGEPYDWSKSECRNKTILFACHGWLSDGNQTWSYDLLSTYVKEYQGCGVASDYSEATKNYNYFAAVCETNNIAEGLADYIHNNICEATDCSCKLHLFGHSMGSHTCGVAGYLLKQKGIVVPRIITADAAGPAYNIANVSDSSIHLSRDSAATVINLKTTCIPGDGKWEWVHQQQIIGTCTCNQNQCKQLDTSCNHGLGIYMVRSTMQSTFQDIKLKKIKTDAMYSCVLPNYADPEITDNLGWRSKGIPGVFKTGKLEVCLDISNSSQQTSKRSLRIKKRNVRTNKRRSRF